MDYRDFKRFDGKISLNIYLKKENKTSKNK